MDPHEAYRDYATYENGYKASTVTAYLQRLGYLEASVGKPFLEVTAADLRDLKRAQHHGDLEIAGGTLKGWFVALRSAFDWATVEGIEVDEAVYKVKDPKVDDDGPPPLPLAVARKLLEACNRPLEYRLVYYSLYAGTRIGESAMICGDMWDDGWLRFPNEKHRGLREVPIHPELEAVKWKLWASEPTDPSGLQRVKRRLAKRIGVRFVSNQLRKTFGSWLYDHDTPDEVVKSLLGHQGDVTRRYAPVSRQRKSDAVATLDYYAPVVLARTG